MRKNLLTIGLLAVSFSVQAQNNVLLHVDATAKMYVSKGTLVYNGGGLQVKSTGNIENRGNFMVVGTSSDTFRNLDSAGNPVINGAGGWFVNKLNEENSYNLVNPTWADAVTTTPPTPVYTYGQLFIDGIPQTNITGVVDQEFRQVQHGSYQQMGFPFYDKTISSLSQTSTLTPQTTALGKIFNNTRYSGNEILYWNNTSVVSQNLPNGLNTRLGVDLDPFSYFIVGATGLNVSTQTRTLVGRPVATVSVSGVPTLSKPLTGAGANVSFGTNGNATNQYNEKYNTYLQDTFSASAGIWQGNFGRNFYQFGNPYMTNLDLSQIALNETDGDGNFLSNIYGVRLEVQGVQYSPNTGGGSSSYKYITFDAATKQPVGDVPYAMVRPMGTFVIKLNNNLVSPESLNFASLRRFNYHMRRSTTPYSVTAAKNNTTATVKQLGVIGLDATGKEIERTYYVVSPSTISGHTQTPTVQVTVGGSSSLGTFEEDPVNGGYDTNNFSYWLYVNEANETNFKGKNIKLVNYNPNVVSFKFEIRENAAEIANGQHLLSSGEGFYYKKDGTTTINPAVQGAVISTPPGNSNGVEYDLYYGLPTGTLGISETTKKSRTLVIYNPDTNGYFVRFDSNWKKADINVFDMSGKMLLNKKDIDASKDYNLDLPQDIKNSYIVTVTSEKGEKVTSKILK
ncbi:MULTISPECIES: T9SS type A sorting domain-containing protein [Chryseobacterium]|uniref:Por secretion system C-terminal sorting domain n=1 Tax=Chryseobacterium taihuense TaxID=1141221 RepID=A0A4U8WFV3_9FLAO|nr:MULTISPECIES: T9SS type A sorting domain-containing protein [Chryseobacterium]QQV01694.1 T9SS type A sorting domain-containing protein [Chryseobacterium sp. FDAARGOS 1104]VFB05103.1 Por secretion system C-terminal sorting domain [Chryseobacterium taihuense]